MTTLLLGSHGMLGRALRDLIPGPLTSIDIDECDITVRDKILRTVDGVQPELIINCAALTDVDGCEKEPEKAMAVNGNAVGHLAEACRIHGAKLVQISTDYVFDGTGREPFGEECSVNPVSAYGRSKLKGEEEALANRDALVMRISWLFGFGRDHFLRMMARFIREGRSLKVIDDQVSRVTYTPDTARALLMLLEHGASGIVHFANRGESTRLDQVRWMANYLGEPDLTVEGVPTSIFNPLARRPAYSVLKTEKYEEITRESPPRWETALTDYLQRDGWA